MLNSLFRLSRLKITDVMRVDFTIYKSSPVPTQIVSPSGKVAFVNSAWHRFWGLADDETLEKTLASYNIFTDPLLHDAGVLPDIKKAFTGQTVTTKSFHYDPQSFGYPGQARRFSAHLQPLTILGVIEGVVMTLLA